MKKTKKVRKSELAVFKKKKVRPSSRPISKNDEIGRYWLLRLDYGSVAELYKLVKPR